MEEIRRVVWAWLATCAVLVGVVALAVTVGLGYHTLPHGRHRISMGEGWNKLIKLFGGAGSFGALFGLIIGGIIVFWAIYRLAEGDVHNGVTAGVAVGFVLVALFVGHTWIRLPSGTGMALVGLLLGIGAVSALITLLQNVLYDNRPNNS